MKSVLALLVVALFLASAATGPAWWPWRLGDEVGWAIVLDLRLPRALLGVLVGAALGLSGAVLQAWLRNPLAEPGVIGVSACASFAASMFSSSVLNIAWWMRVSRPFASSFAHSKNCPYSGTVIATSDTSSVPRKPSSSSLRMS